MVSESFESSSETEFPWERPVGFRDFVKQLAVGLATGAVLNTAEAKEGWISYSLKIGWGTDTVAIEHNRKYGTSFKSREINRWNGLTDNQAKKLRPGTIIWVPLNQRTRTIKKAIPIQKSDEIPRAKPIPETEMQESAEISMQYPPHWNSTVIELINLENNGRAEDDGGLKTHLKRTMHDPNNLINSSKLTLKPLSQPNHSAERFVPDQETFREVDDYETYVCLKIAPTPQPGGKEQMNYGYVGFKHPTRGLILTHSFLFSPGTPSHPTLSRTDRANGGIHTILNEEDIIYERKFGKNYWSNSTRMKNNMDSLRKLNSRTGFELSETVFKLIGESRTYAEAQGKVRGMTAEIWDAVKKCYIPATDYIPNTNGWGYMTTGKVTFKGLKKLHGTGTEWAIGLKKSHGCGRMTNQDFACLFEAFGLRAGSGIDIQEA